MPKAPSFIDKQSVKNIGLTLFEERRTRNLYLYQVQRQTGIPAKIIEGLELGRFVKFSVLRKLTDFYGKKLKIFLE